MVSCNTPAWACHPTATNSHTDVCEYAAGVVGTASRKLHRGSVEKCKELLASFSLDSGRLFGRTFVVLRSSGICCALADGRDTPRSVV